MKNLYIFLIFIAGLVGFGQKNVIGAKFNAEAKQLNFADKFGTNFELSDLFIEKSQTTNVFCNSGIFNLYFEAGSGMEGSSTLENNRRAVICQVFNDLSNFINSPLKNSGNNIKVNIFIRNLSNITGAPPNVLGVCSSFYNFPVISNQTASSIVDTEVWRTIIAGKDSYTNVAQPLQSVDPNSSGAYYHAYMAFNFNFGWNTNLLINAPANVYDLYTVVLHEAIHSLGFTNLIDENGLSRFGAQNKYYSRYDTFLKNNNLTQSLIKNTSGCSLYNYSWNNNLSTNILQPARICNNQNLTCCETAIKFAGISTVPVFTPSVWKNGSSLSHFEDECIGVPNGNNSNLYFAMTDANDVGTTKRFLTSEERNALADLGYSMNATYGSNSVVFNSYKNYSTPNIGLTIGGINDGILNNNYTFSANQGTLIPISGILNNDFNAVSFECLEDLSSTSLLPTTLSFTSGNINTVIDFTSNLPGIHLLRYVPVNALN